MGNYVEVYQQTKFRVRVRVTFNVAWLVLDLEGYRYPLQWGVLELHELMCSWFCVTAYTKYPSIRRGGGEKIDLQNQHTTLYAHCCGHVSSTDLIPSPWKASWCSTAVPVIAYVVVSFLSSQHGSQTSGRRGREGWCQGLQG